MALTKINLRLGGQKKSPHGNDVRYGTERFLQKVLGSQEIYCLAADKGEVRLAVRWPIVQHEAYLLEEDLRAWLDEQLGYTLKKIRVIQQW